MVLVIMNLNISFIMGWGGGGGLKKLDLMGKDFFRFCMG